MSSSTQLQQSQQSQPPLPTITSTSTQGTTSFSSNATTSSNFSVQQNNNFINSHSSFSAATAVPTSSSSAIPASKPKSESSRLSIFLAECLSVGCLKGFRYFELYLRGREELLLRVYTTTQQQQQQKNNDDDDDDESKFPPGCSNSNIIGGYDQSSLNSSSNSSSFVLLSRQPSSKDLALALSSSFSGKNRQRLAWQSTENLPPASPCDRELEKDSSKTAFLIAGYARYKCPFVWLRTNHSHFIKTNDVITKQDDPVKLISLAKWKAPVPVQVSVIDIIAELVITTLPQKPKNPLEICHPFFDSLPLQESLVCCGAVLNLLRKIYVSDSPLAQFVLEDIEKLSKRYFTESIELHCAIDEYNNNTLKKLIK